MLLDELRSELGANAAYFRRSVLFLGLGLGAITLGGPLGSKVGLTLLLWHGFLALTQPVFTLLARERRDARERREQDTALYDRGERAVARLLVLLAFTMPSALVLALVFLTRVGRDAFATPLAAGVCLVVGGVLLLVMVLGCVSLITRSVGLVVLTYAAAVVLILLGMTPAGAALLPGVPLWLALATRTGWGLALTLVWQLACAALLFALAIDVGIRGR